MITTYDRLYGDGAGETFFMGPYLDSLPAAVTVRVKNRHMTALAALPARQ